MAAATLDPEKTLSWEKRHRPRAAIASLIGALGLLVYYIAMERLRSGGPSISGLEALQRGVASGPVADLPSLRLAEFQYLHDQQWLVLAIGIGAFIGFVGMAWAAGFLGVATRARSAEFRRFLIYVPIIGGVVLGLGTLIIQVSVAALTSDFLDGPRTVESATRTSTTLQQFGQVMFSVGSLLLAVGLVIISLNAMRVGPAHEAARLHRDRRRRAAGARPAAGRAGLLGRRARLPVPRPLARRGSAGVENG